MQLYESCSTSIALQNPQQHFLVVLIDKIGNVYRLRRKGRQEAQENAQRHPQLGLQES